VRTRCAARAYSFGDILTEAPQRGRTVVHVFACVTSFAASLLYLAPVIAMVGFVVYAKVRGRGAEPETDMEAAPAFDLEREFEPIA
jgi:hypothetical protein